MYYMPLKCLYKTCIEFLVFITIFSLEQSGCYEIRVVISLDCVRVEILNHQITLNN